MRKRSELKIYGYQEAYKKFFEDGLGVREIARFFGSLSFNNKPFISTLRSPLPGIWKRMKSFEKAMCAWEKSTKSKSRKRLRLKSKRIRKFVRYVLCRWCWSPESISTFIKRHGVRISAKAIITSLSLTRPLVMLSNSSLVDYFLG